MSIHVLEDHTKFFNMCTVYEIILSFYIYLQIFSLQWIDCTGIYVSLFLVIWFWGTSIQTLNKEQFWGEKLIYLNQSKKRNSSIRIIHLIITSAPSFNLMAFLKVHCRCISRRNILNHCNTATGSFYFHRLRNKESWFFEYNEMIKHWRGVTILFTSPPPPKKNIYQNLIIIYLIFSDIQGCIYACAASVKWNGEFVRYITVVPGGISLKLAFLGRHVIRGFARLSWVDLSSKTSGDNDRDVCTLPTTRHGSWMKKQTRYNHSHISLFCPQNSPFSIS